MHGEAVSAAGRVYGIGIGPGDPELITLKALRLLRAAPVLAYPAPEHGDSLAFPVPPGLAVATKRWLLVVDAPECESVGAAIDNARERFCVTRVGTDRCRRQGQGQRDRAERPAGS